MRPIATIRTRERAWRQCLSLRSGCAAEPALRTGLSRGTERSVVAGKNVRLEHLAFGTVNGLDGKPFKTREAESGVRLDLMQMLVTEAQKRIREAGMGTELGEQEGKGRRNGRSRRFEICRSLQHDRNRIIYLYRPLFEIRGPYLGTPDRLFIPAAISRSPASNRCCREPPTRGGSALRAGPDRL